MDDFNATVLSEAKNEYSSRLVNILTPLVIQGFKSIFQEAWDLCIKNEEDAKYLMTFQNFLTRVPRWNQEIINVETKRILDSSKCLYLEDLLTCVHITQLKILTSIRVSNKQKKIEIDIPKLHDYIHKVYIAAARKLYQNVYLFEENILPLSKQKNMRECEIIVKESILNVIRENMPIEKILRAYIDETVEEEIVEETDEVPITEEEDKKEKEAAAENASAVNDDSAKSAETTQESTNPKAPSPILVTKNKDIQSEDNTPSPSLSPPSSPEIQKEISNVKIEVPSLNPPSPKSTTKISFNDKDNVVKFSQKDDPTIISSSPPTLISAPKTIERLERISTERHEQRKREEAEEEEDDGGDSIKIFDGPNIKLDTLDIQTIGGNIKLNNKPELTNVEVLA